MNKRSFDGSFTPLSKSLALESEPPVKSRKSDGSSLNTDEDMPGAYNYNGSKGQGIYDQFSTRSDTNDEPSLRPYPFFYYEDFSEMKDPNPSIPLTEPGKVPSFPAKMHAILSRQELKDIVSWMPHGRSWKVHKPREFEVNGWGFHRITVDSRDRNSYYHPLFIRGLPHLCKTMKRPGVTKKVTVKPEHEPDLYEVSKFHPVPGKVVDDSAIFPYKVGRGRIYYMSSQSVQYLPAGRSGQISGDGSTFDPERHHHLRQPSNDGLDCGGIQSHNTRDSSCHVNKGTSSEGSTEEMDTCVLTYPEKMQVQEEQQALYNDASNNSPTTSGQVAENNDPFANQRQPANAFQPVVKRAEIGQKTSAMCISENLLRLQQKHFRMLCASSLQKDR